MDNLKSQLLSLGQKVKVVLVQLQERLSKGLKLGQGSGKTTAQNMNPSASKSPNTSLLLDRVKGELLEAWAFIQNRFFPTLLGFVSNVVNKIDPPLSKAVAKFTSNPTVINTWQKLQSTNLWQKTSIAIAPIWRSLTETLKPITTSDSFKPLLAKPLGTFALILALTFLLSLRPHPAASVTVQKLGQKAIVELLPPESGDVPISPEKVLVSSIQAQVIDISKSYGEALIDSVQTNFRLGRLIVQLSESWYQLNPDLQQQLVTDLEKRSQALSFKKLFIVDSDQHLLARTPAIVQDGSPAMIILRR